MELKQIKPKGKESDKYSINLYKYLKKNPEYNKVYYQTMHYVKVGCGENHKEIYEYRHRDFDINDFKLTEIYLSAYPIWYIQRDDILTGSKLISILRGGRGMYENFAYCSTSHELNYVDITDIFWDKYIEIGRCIWDNKHNGYLQNDDNRFTYIDENNRICNWCGEKQHRKIKIEHIEKKKEIWS